MRDGAKLLLSLLLPVAVILLSPPIASGERRSNGGSLHSSLRHPAGEDQHALALHHCGGTLYPSLCYTTLAAVPGLARKTVPELISALVNRTAAEARMSSRNCTAILEGRRGGLTPMQRLALGDCLELISDTLDDLRSALSDLRTDPGARLDRLATLLSAAMTNQDTCLDGFSHVPGGGARRFIERRLRRVSRLTSNSLALLKKIRRGGRGSYTEPLPGYGEVKDGFPSWVSAGDRRRLLQTSAGGNATKPNVVVAKDGSGNFTTVSAAVAAAPNNTAGRYVIYIKAGGYFENVEVDKNKMNIMFLGDGIGKTVIKASRSVGGGFTTFRSATVAVVGNNFLAKGITIENSAGAAMHQAVALRVGADLSVFYQCSFVGYQDTLYVHSLRQFYRECDIYGTVDFVFGNAATVLQNCNLYARKPLDNQKNIFTAQGREDPNQNTGISIHNSKVAAGSDLIPVVSQFQSFLGRPWKEYSRTVYLLSNMEGLIDPAGWMEWNGTFGLNTLYYGEYRNRGPGANTTARVKWPGYRIITNATEAELFTPAAFIQGNEWIGATNVPFTSGLT